MPCTTRKRHQVFKFNFSTHRECFQWSWTVKQLYECWLVEGRNWIGKREQALDLSGSTHLPVTVITVNTSTHTQQNSALRPPLRSQNRNIGTKQDIWHHDSMLSSVLIYSYGGQEVQKEKSKKAHLCLACEYTMAWLFGKISFKHFQDETDIEADGMYWQTQKWQDIHNTPLYLFRNSENMET